MNMPITDPTDTRLRFALLSATILLGRDKRTRNYVKLYRTTRAGGAND
jgi:hypothetical protein